jgi:hypothetical protein
VVAGSEAKRDLSQHSNSIALHHSGHMGYYHMHINEYTSRKHSKNSYLKLLTHTHTRASYKLIFQLFSGEFGNKIAAYAQYKQPLAETEVFTFIFQDAELTSIHQLIILQIAGLTAAFCNVAAIWLEQALPRSLSCTARALDGGLAQRRLLATTIYSIEAGFANGSPLNTTIAARLSTADGAELFTNELKLALARAPALITPAWNIIPDVPIVFYQMELLFPSVRIYGLNGNFVLNFDVPNTYVDGSVSLTFSSITLGAVPLVHTYTVPFFLLHKHGISDGSRNQRP